MTITRNKKYLSRIPNQCAVEIVNTVKAENIYDRTFNKGAVPIMEL